MTKLAVTYPSPRRLVLDHLQAIRGTRLPAGATVGVNVPPSWTSASPVSVVVDSDGVPSMQHPVVEHATVRVVVRAATTMLAEETATLVQGLILAGGWPPTFSVQPLTGPLAASDPDSHSELCSFTVRVNVRSTPIT